MCNHHMANRVGVGRAFQADRRSDKERSGVGESEWGARKEGTWGEAGRGTEHPHLTLRFSSSVFPLLLLKATLQGEKSFTAERKQT